METIAILLVFFIIVFIGLVLYTNIMKSSVEQKIDEYNELSKIQTVQIVSSLPELQCSMNNIIDLNCVDKLKLIVGSETAEDQNYFDLFGYSRITIKQMFPVADEWIFYNRMRGDRGMSASYFPISIYDPERDAYNFGIMIVEVEQ